ASSTATVPASGGAPPDMRCARHRACCGNACRSSRRWHERARGASGRQAVSPRPKDWLFIQRFRGIIAASLDNRQQGKAHMDDNKARGEKAKALAAALAQIEKQFGKGSVMRMADGEVARDLE